VLPEIELPAVTAGAVISAVPGLQTGAGLVIASTGTGFTLTLTISVDVQPVADIVVVTVYVDVVDVPPVVSVTVGFETEEELRPVVAAQAYVSPAVEATPIFPVDPEQKEISGPAFETGKGLIVTVTGATSVQPPAVVDAT
jgi:hypothetical protein